MIVNLLTADEQDIGSGASTWQAQANCTVSRSTVRYRVSPASLLVTPATVGGATMTVDLVRTVPVTGGTTYRVFASARNDSPGSSFGVQPLLYDAGGTELEAGEHRGGSVTVFGRWVVVVSKFTAPLGAVTAKVRLDSDAVQGGTYFDVIGLVEWDETGVVGNEFLNLMLSRGIPRYMREADEGFTDPDHPFARYLDLVAHQADNVLTTVLAFDYIAEVDGVQGYDRSTLVQPEYYPTPYAAEPSWLPWLSQLVGVRPVYPTGGGSLTPWYYLESTYPTWNAWQTIDPAANPAFPLASLSRNATTGVVTAVYGAQSAGPAYTPVVGDPVEVTGVSAFNGAFVVLTVDTGTSTLTWSDPGSAATASTGTVTFSDVSWLEAEGINPTAFDALSTLKHLTRTTATGIRAGSTAAVVDAARSVLAGQDVPATARRSGGVLTVTTKATHTFSVGDYISVRESSVPSMNITGTVASVDGTTVGSTITVTSAGPDTGSTDCYVTDRQVQFTQTAPWEWTLDTLAEQTYAADLLEQVVGQAKAAGMLVTFGTI